MKTVAEMKARLRAIAVEAETAEGEALNVLLKEADEIKAKIDEANDRAHIKGIADGISGDPADGKPSEKGYARISVRNPSARRFRGYFEWRHPSRLAKQHFCPQFGMVG